MVDSIYLFQVGISRTNLSFSGSLYDWLLNLSFGKFHLLVLLAETQMDPTHFFSLPGDHNFCVSFPHSTGRDCGCLLAKTTWQKMGQALYDYNTQAFSFCLATDLSLPRFLDDTSCHFEIGLSVYAASGQKPLINWGLQSNKPPETQSCQGPCEPLPRQAARWESYSWLTPWLPCIQRNCAQTSDPQKLGGNQFVFV